MKNWENRSKELQIVLTGAFNPAIITPDWLIKKEIIEDYEYDRDSIKENLLIHRDVAQFDLTFASILVMMNRFQIISKDETKFERVRDLVFKSFQLLSETPVEQIGINHCLIAKCFTETEWKGFGDGLVPKSHWQMLKEPGLMSLQIHSRRDDDKRGHILVTVNTDAAMIPKRELCISVNDHYELSDISTLREILAQENWVSSTDRANKIYTGVLKNAD